MEQKPYGEQAQAGMEETRAHATEAVRSAAQSGGGYLENQKRLLATEVDGYSCALHETADRLHAQGQDRVAAYAERIAGGLDGLAHNLRERDLREGLDTVADYAKRQPMIFLGGAAAVGFLVTRFMKSSTHEEPGEESAMKEGAGKLKEKVAGGMQKARETMGMEEKEQPEKSRGGAEPPASQPHGHTAAEVEIPVILRPHEPPDQPAPRR